MHIRAIMLISLFTTLNNVPTAVAYLGIDFGHLTSSSTT